MIAKANQLSSNWHKWDILEKITNETFNDLPKVNRYQCETYEKNIFRKSSYDSKEVILNRRSVQIMDKLNSRITYTEFEILLASIKSSNSFIHIIIFVHNVNNLDSGLYILIRNHKQKQQFEKILKKIFYGTK